MQNWQAGLTLENPSVAVAWLKSQGVRSLTVDSRHVKSNSNSAFIAWPGTALDGRQFVAQALQDGALAALVEDSTDAITETAPLNLLRATLPQPHRQIAAYKGLKAAAGEIASLFYGVPSAVMPVVAFTGTNGKTSSSWWLAQAMGGAVVGTLGIGRLQAQDNGAPLLPEFQTGLTTPDPTTLHDKLAQLVQQSCSVIALEASSIGLVEGRLNGTSIHTAVFTNFTLDHLDYHGTMEAYWQAKSSLFDWPGLKAAVINTDDLQGIKLLERLSAKKALELWSIGLDHPARLMAKNIKTTPIGLQFDVVETGAEQAFATHTLQTQLIGRYNISNLLGVIAAMRSLGLALSACVEACSRISPVPGRLQVVSALNTGLPKSELPLVELTLVELPLVVVDYAHTPDALESALTAMRELADHRGGKLWCIFGGGLRDATKRPIMGAKARAHSDFVVVTSDNPRTESPASIIAQILLGLEEDANVQVQIDRALAIKETIEQASAFDVILIAGKGHENYQEIAGQRLSFSDSAHAQAALIRWRNPS
jgi:UDP-N-acetylmuramoyl-L-alanyl-D-glutamate--2,6-diaminopimelate ligase